VRRAFAHYLSKMSYGKGGYSESLDPQSFFDVDHYRPKPEVEAPVEDVTDRMPIAKQVKSITSKTLPSSAHSEAARAQLIRLGAAALSAQPAEVLG
jgi:hypothetical protein